MKKKIVLIATLLLILASGSGLLATASTDNTTNVTLPSKVLAGLEYRCGSSYIGAHTAAVNVYFSTPMPDYNYVALVVFTGAYPNALPMGSFLKVVYRTATYFVVNIYRTSSIMSAYTYPQTQQLNDISFDWMVVPIR